MTAKPAPLTATLEMVTVPLPVLVKETECVDELPRPNEPKTKELALSESSGCVVAREGIPLPETEMCPGASFRNWNIVIVPE